MLSSVAFHPVVEGTPEHGDVAKILGEGSYLSRAYTRLIHALTDYFEASQQALPLCGVWHGHEYGIGRNPSYYPSESEAHVNRLDAGPGAMAVPRRRREERWEQ